MRSRRIFESRIGTVDGLEVVVRGERREDVERHMEQLDHEGSTGWKVETMSQGEAFCQDAVHALLVGMGHDPGREGLKETPRRVAKSMAEICTPKPFDFTVFDAEGMDEMVVQAGIPFYSLCEHHMLPFFGEAAVAYIPDGKIVGLSKLARAVQYCAAGLQNQERITTSVADMLQAKLAPKGVGVVLKARHLCMEMRGVRTAGTATTTSRMLGAMLDKPEARAEFLRLAKV